VAGSIASRTQASRARARTPSSGVFLSAEGDALERFVLAIMTCARANTFEDISDAAEPGDNDPIALEPFSCTRANEIDDVSLDAEPRRIDHFALPDFSCAS
jgi:hypothetical protein